MTVEIKMLEEKWLAAAVEVWNEVVEDGEAFPQTELLTAETGRDFLRSSPTRAWPGMRARMRLSECIFYIRITWADAGISATRATR